METASGRCSSGGNGWGACSFGSFFSHKLVQMCIIEQDERKMTRFRLFTLAQSSNISNIPAHFFPALSFELKRRQKGGPLVGCN